MLASSVETVFPAEPVFLLVQHSIANHRQSSCCQNWGLHSAEDCDFNEEEVNQAKLSTKTLQFECSVLSVTRSAIV